jgi:hypothetical protein
MSDKISNGELKQENLLSDAMQFASIMPGLFGNANTASSDEPNKPSRPANMPDMSQMMNMMSSMMGNKNNNDMFKAMAAMNGMNNNKSSKKTKTSFNTSAIKKKAAASKLRSKLNKRNDTSSVNKENSDDTD